MSTLGQRFPHLKGRPLGAVNGAQLAELARRWGYKNGYEGREGGWIYLKGSERPIIQGWFSFGMKGSIFPRVEAAFVAGEVKLPPRLALQFGAEVRNQMGARP